MADLRRLVAYRVPGELGSCPACASPSPTPLEPLSLAVPPVRDRRVGFVSGCRRCGVLFANPLPPSEVVTGAYKPEGEWGLRRQHAREEPVSRARIARIFDPVQHDLDVLRPPPGAAVLDFGCGLGGLLDTLAASGWATYGLEPATRVAFERHREVVDVPGAPTFDLVVLHHVLEHVTAPLAILRQLAAATRSGGYLLVSVPNLDTLPQHGELEYCIRSKTHILAYTSDCLAWLGAEAGFRLAAPPRNEGTRDRQRVVLLRREPGPVDHPRDPLRSAVRTLWAYHASHPDPTLPSRRWPVRLRAAILNRRRLRRPRVDGVRA